MNVQNSMEVQSIQQQNWKAERNSANLFYGYLTFIITIIFILILPSWNRVSNHIYYKFLQINKWFKFNPKKSFLRLNPMSAQMIIFWSILLSILSLSDTHWDLRFIASRLGRVPVYCLPTVLFLTLRPSPLNEVLYLQLLPIHKWLSRIVILQSLLHTLFYIYLMSQNGTLFKLSKFDNMNGIVAMFAFIIIIITSLPIIRRSFFKIFFINHYICTWIVTLTLYFHVRPGIPYLTLLNCFILLYQIYYKFKISKISKISTVKIADQMIIVNLPNDSISNKCNLPGCHIRLIDYDDTKPKFWNYLKLLFIPIQHPYTLASLPVDKSQKLIVRVGNYKIKNNNNYLITGSYLPHLSFIKKLKSTNNISNSLLPTFNNNNNNGLNSLLVSTKVKKCLIVVGGSAISFALPILRILNYNGSMVKIIWVIRDHEDLKVLDYFKNYLINDDCIDIFITGHYTSSEISSFKDALTDLHNKKMELELKQETEFLSGGFSYNKNDKMNSPIFENLESFSSNSTGLVSQSDRNDENTPLNNTSNIISYGSSYFKDELNSMHRKSYIDFRNHNQQISSSYNDETIDIELHEKDIYSKNLPMIPPNVLSKPSAGVGYNDQLTNDTTINKSSDENVKDITTNDSKMDKTSPNSKISKYLPFNYKSKTASDSTYAQSALYDDLENYWVLKDSFSRIEFGRPKLGLYYYSWCIGSSCIGPLVNLDTGESICYNIRDDPTSVYNDQINELYSNDTFLANRKARIQERNGKPDEDTWVIGAGPSGLVDNVRLWANDCGFCFHEESFII